uniref:TLC domain-containing protein n=1 Tax=Panagrellus redivivus TaxID=6233 RepID=A0A7E4UZF9_PANRE
MPENDSCDGHSSNGGYNISGSGGMGGLWDPKYWLPRDVGWEDLPINFYDLIYPIYFAIPILIFRVLLESFVGFGVGCLLGVVPREELSARIKNHLCGGFARYTRSKRVLECMFRFVTYSMLFSYGYFVLSDKSWFADVKNCWIGFPFHKIENSVWWYYMLETGFYYALFFGSVFDVKRSDFWQLVLHHVITIMLLSVSWTINFVRIGTLVLICHDISDIILEAGKLVRYYGSPSFITNCFFFAFLISWFVTRLGYFPFVLLRSGLFEAADLIQPDYKILNLYQVPHIPRVIILMLLCLLVLHVFWTVIIMKIVIRSITVGEAADVRSESEEEDNFDPSNRQKLLKTRKERNAAVSNKKGQ